MKKLIDFLKFAKEQGVVFAIKYQLGIAKEGKDFISMPYDDMQIQKRKGRIGMNEIVEPVESVELVVRQRSVKAVHKST